MQEKKPVMIYSVFINVRENRKDNKEWTIQRHWQHWEQNQDKIKQTKAQHIKLERWTTLTSPNLLRRG
jgi:hypothetical protein